MSTAIASLPGNSINEIIITDSLAIYVNHFGAFKSLIVTKNVTEVLVKKYLM